MLLRHAWLAITPHRHWWDRQDLNLHGLSDHSGLSRGWLPITSLSQNKNPCFIWAGEQILLSHSLSYPANISKSENQLYEQKFLISGTKISKILLFAKNILSLHRNRNNECIKRKYYGQSAEGRTGTTSCCDFNLCVPFFIYIKHNITRAGTGDATAPEGDLPDWSGLVRTAPQN